MDFPFAKYLLLTLLFIFAYVALYTEKIEVYGFGSSFALQTLFTIMVFMDILKDPFKTYAVISIPSIPNTLVKIPDLKITFYWIILIGTALQFIASTIMMVIASNIYKRYGEIRISRDNRQIFDRYKWMYILVNFLLLVLLFGYFNYNQGYSPNFKLILLFCIISSLLLGSIELYYANKLSNILGKTVDG